MRILSMVLTFLFFVYVARISREKLGEFATVFTYFIFLQQAPLLGLHIVVTREVAAGKEPVGHLATNTLAVALLAALVLCPALGSLGMTLYPRELWPAFWLVGLSMFPTALTNVVDSVLIGQERIGRLALVGGIENIARAVGSFAVMPWFDLTGVFTVFLLGRCLAVVLYLRWSGLADVFRRDDCSVAAVLGFFAICPTYLGILILSSGINRFDSMLLSFQWLAGPEAMRAQGTYNAAYRLYDIALMVPSVLTVVLFPVFTRYHETARERFDELTRYLFRYCVVVGMPFSIMLAMNADLVIGAIFRKADYAGSAQVLEWLIFIPVIVGLDQILTIVLLASRRQHLDLRVLASSCTIYLALLLLLIPRYTYLGAAAATFMTMACQMAIRFWLVRSRIGIEGLLPAVARPVLAAGVMAAVMYVLRDQNRLVAIAAGLPAYAAALWGLGAVRKHDLALFGSALAERKQVPA